MGTLKLHARRWEANAKLNGAESVSIYFAGRRENAELTGITAKGKGVLQAPPSAPRRSPSRFMIAERTVVIVVFQIFSSGSAFTRSVIVLPSCLGVLSMMVWVAAFVLLGETPKVDA